MLMRSTAVVFGSPIVLDIVVIECWTMLIYILCKMLWEYVCVSGVVAKEFFEKSKLPVQELSKIWYCCQSF